MEKPGSTETQKSNRLFLVTYIPSLKFFKIPSMIFLSNSVHSCSNKWRNKRRQEEK